MTNAIKVFVDKHQNKLFILLILYCIIYLTWYGFWYMEQKDLQKNITYMRGLCESTCKGMSLPNWEYHPNNYSCVCSQAPNTLEMYLNNKK